MTSRPAALLAGFTALALTGCGSSSVHHVTVTRTTTGPGSGTTTLTSTTTSHQAPGSSTTSSALAGHSPEAIVAAAGRALRSSGGYAMVARLRENGARLGVELTTNGRSYDAAIAEGRGAFEVLNLPPRVFWRANRAFWNAHEGHTPQARAIAARLAGRWLVASGAEARSLRGSLGTLAPASLARCLGEDHGTLRAAGRTSVDGRSAIVLRDLGDKPGASPGTLAVAADGPPYPLRLTVTGRSRAGGRIDACNDGKPSSAIGTVSLSRFGAIGPLRAPHGVLSEGGSSAGAT